jgi:hypothetical protein
VARKKLPENREREEKSGQDGERSDKVNQEKQKALAS